MEKSKVTLALLVAWMPLAVVGQEVAVAGQEVDTSFILMKHRGNAADVDEFHRGQGGRAKRFQNFNWSYMPTPPGMVKKNYENSRLFERVEYPKMCSVVRVPNDPLYPQMWGLQKIQAAGGWDVATTNSVVVAVIDTGIDFNHPDLRGNLWTGPNGEHGYSATNGVLVNGGQDNHSHGTHVAGTIGAVGNNGLGIPGINWKVQLAAFKFLGAGGSGSSLGAALCIDRMITLKQQGHNIRVSNNSWGAIANADPFLEDAFTAASQNGILNVCAAGNNSTDTDVLGHVPSSLPVNGIVSVVASDQNDNKAGFSNFGVTSTDLMAPGVSILSTRLNGDYWLLSGTSMASPHVAGACAAMFGFAPSLTALEGKAVLLHPDSYDRTAFTATSTGGGRLNLRKLLTNPLTQNPPPLNQEPTLTLNVTTNFISVPPNWVLTITASATDPEGDALTYSISQRHPNLVGLMSVMANDNLQDRDFTSNVFSITNVPTGREYALEVRFGVSDGRGGGASKSVTLWMERDEALIRQLPTPVLTLVTNTSPFEPYPIGVFCSMPGISGSEAEFTITISRADSLGHSSIYPVNSVVPLALGLTPGPNAFRAQVVDIYGNFAQSEQLRVDVGSTVFMPNARGTVNSVRSPAPFNSVMDLSASNPTGRVFDYFDRPWFVTGLFFGSDPRSPIRRQTLNTLGLHAWEYEVTDVAAGTVDALVAVYTATPGTVTQPPTNPPPPVNLTPPQDLRVTMVGTMLRLTWSNTATGEDRYDLEVRTKAKGPWTSFRLLASLSADATSFSFAPSRNTMYEFRLKACKDSTCGPYSNTTSIRVR